MKLCFNVPQREALVPHREALMSQSKALREVFLPYNLLTIFHQSTRGALLCSALQNLQTAVSTWLLFFVLLQCDSFLSSHLMFILR